MITVTGTCGLQWQPGTLAPRWEPQGLNLDILASRHSVTIGKRLISPTKTQPKHSHHHTANLSSPPTTAIIMSSEPSLTINGSASSISRSSLPHSSPLYTAYPTSFREVLQITCLLLIASYLARTVATQQLCSNRLFNADKGSVFTRDGRNALEASVIVSRGYRKRGVASLCELRLRIQSC